MRRVPLLLLDRDALQRGQSGRIIMETSTAVWGGTEVSWSSPRLEGRIREDLAADTRAIAGLAAAARDGRIRLGACDDVRDEVRAGRRHTEGWKSDEWRDVMLERVASAVHWSHLVPWSSNGPRTLDECRQSALERLVAWARTGVPAAKADSFRESVRSALADLPTFARIVKAAGSNKHADALHLWNAVRAGADCFVTCDGRLRNALGHSKIAESQLLVSPTDACTRFGIDARNPPLQNGEKTWMFD